MIDSATDFLDGLVDQMPCKPPMRLISEYIEGRRMLPSGTPFPGIWQNARTPYMVEPMDTMAPYSGITEMWMKKGAQIGATAAILENLLAYYMDEYPAEILFISATDDALEKWSTKRLGPVIDSCGFRHKIADQNVGNEKSRKTGDKTFSKHYPGGALNMASAQSAASLRSDSKRIVMFDEVDGAPPQLKTGEGNFVDVARVRTNAWGVRKKIVGISTPTKIDSSQITLLHRRGDQRVYLVPCPHCGLMQPLVMQEGDMKHGLTADMVAGKARTVFYQCEGGCDPIYNHHKTFMLQRGVWQPTATPEEKYIRSYHISSLYSPVGMLSWEELYSEYLNAQNKPDGMVSFENLYLGMESRETGSRPKLENVIELRGAYSRGNVPHGVVFLTMGIDVQRGSARSENNKARIECEILGHGLGYRTWSIDYKIFYGSTEQVGFGAWAELQKWATDGGLVFRRQDGAQFSPSLVFIDSGDGPNSSNVYEFCLGWKNTFPSKGFDALKKQKHESYDGSFTDEAGPTAYKKFRPTKITDETTLYTISTLHYKTLIYSNLKKVRAATASSNPPGFCEFPYDYPDEYFDGLTAEEKRRDGSFHLPGGRRNEPLDCRVYALCAADVYLEACVLTARENAKKAGAPKDQIMQINSRYILERILQKVGA